MPGARSYSLSELVETTGFDRRTIVYYIQSGLLPKVGRRGPHTRYPEECLTRLLFIKGVRKLQSQGQLLTATLAEIRRALSARDGTGIRELLDRDLPVDEVTALFEEPAALGPEARGQEARVAQPGPVAPAIVGQSPPPAPGPGALRGPAGERRSYGLADAGIRRRFGSEKPAVPEVPGAEIGPGPPAPQSPTFEQPPQIAAPIPPPLPAAVSTAAETGAGVDPELGDLLRELEVRPTMNARRSPPGSPEQWTEIPITSRIYLSVRGLPADDAPLAEAVARLLKRALRGRLPTAPV